MGNRNTGRTTRRLIHCLSRQIPTGEKFVFVCRDLNECSTRAHQYAQLLSILGIKAEMNQKQYSYTVTYDFKYDGVDTGEKAVAEFLSSVSIFGMRTGLIIGDIDDEI